MVQVPGEPLTSGAIAPVNVPPLATTRSQYQVLALVVEAFACRMLGVPALVLTGSEDDGAAALARLDRGGAWARKDAGPPDIIAALDALLPGHPGDAAGPLAVAALGGLVVVFAALLLYLVWTAIV